MPCENEGKDLGACMSQGTPKIANQPTEARGEAWNQFVPTAFRRNQPLTLDF